MRTVLRALWIGEPSEQQPTIGWHVHGARGPDEAGRQVAISAWTFPSCYSRNMGSGLYKFYYGPADGFMFLVDARDVTAYDARDKLGRMMSEPESQGKPLLVYANFSDKLQAETPPETTQAAAQAPASCTEEARISEALGLDELSARFGSPVDVQLTSAVSDPEVSGVTRGYERLMISIAGQRAKKREGTRA